MNWSWLPWSGRQLQSSASFSVLIDAVADALNGMVKAEVDSLIQAGELKNLEKSSRQNSIVKTMPYHSKYPITWVSLVTRDVLYKDIL